MADQCAEPDKPLHIMHVLRAPLGGLFRHVLDLCREQVRRGHRVGLIADSLTGGEHADRTLAALEPRLQLGLRRLPMRRNPHPSDIGTLFEIRRLCAEASADVVHGHGSKGGVYARFSGRQRGSSAPLRVYTPHGGSLNHRPGTLLHRFYMGAEGVMAARTDLLLFESAYIAERFQTFVGPPPHLHRIVRNGIAEAEFAPVQAAPDAGDFLYVGELRAMKGIDTLIDALALVGRSLGSQPRAVLAGSGPDREALQRHAERLGIAGAITFAGVLPARQAFARGKVLVVPSRAESLPYVVLEAAGARIPMIATDVGGIPEIFGPYKDRLLRPDDAPGLAARMIETLATPVEQRAAAARDLARFVQARFSIDTMADGVLAAYGDAFAERASGRSAPPLRPPVPSYDRGTET